MSKLSEKEVAELVKQSVKILLTDEYRFLTELEEVRSLALKELKIQKRKREILKDLKEL